jgi:hypothetical protein
MRISTQTVFGALGAAFVAAALWAVTTEADPGPLPKLRPTRDTTFLIAPLDDDGDVDYAAALNETYGRDVDPDDNVLVGLWNAWGRNALDEPPPASYFDALGAPPPAEGMFQTEYHDHVREASKGDAAIVERLNQQFDAATDRPWTSAEFPEVAAWIRRNEAPLARVVEAVGRERFYRPIVSRRDVPGDPLYLNIAPYELGLARESARLLVCRAYLRMGERKFAAAADDLLACRLLGRVYATGPAYSDTNVAAIVDAMAYYAERNLLDLGALNAAELRRYLDELREWGPLPSPADAINQTDRFCYLDAVQRLREQNPEVLGAPYLMKKKSRAARIDFEAVLRLGNRWFDRTVGARRRRRFDPAMGQAQLAQLRTELTAIDKKFSERMRRDGSVVDSIADDEFPEYCLAALFPKHRLSAFDEFDRQEQEFDLSKIAVVLELLRAENGSYPQRLDELRPTYLRAEPNDRYSGAPLIYRREGDGYVLYSVGPNGRDDGGVSEQFGPQATDELDDRVVRMPAAAK